MIPKILVIGILGIIAVVLLTSILVALAPYLAAAILIGFALRKLFKSLSHGGTASTSTDLIAIDPQEKS